MTTLTLHLRRSERPVHEAAAWFIAGSQPSAWLEELAAWNIPLDACRLYVLPAGRDDLSPVGVLVVPPATARPDVSPRCWPYGVIAGRLYLPLEAGLQPAAEPGELAAQLTGETGVWHPAVDLVAFEAHDARRVSELLALPPRRPADWNHARAGGRINQRLLSLEPQSTPSLETIFQLGRDDIGSQSPQLDSLPPAPDEPPSGIAEAAQKILRPVARFIDWLASQGSPRAKGSQGSGGPGWLDKLHGWARRVLQASASQSQREREIRRLLNLLSANPDEGLKFALPVGGTGAHRGVARPSDRLNRREVDFNLRRLGGGGPADFWAVDPQTHIRLVEEYRRLADREMQLGRYRRAAYIFAELLGDLLAATMALERGHHWREAAVLFREKLARPHDAARCLEQGGLWNEAIALYRELREHEHVGDLYAQLDQPENAALAYRAALEQAEASQDLLTAARLLEEKLGLPDDALECLARGWPHSSQAMDCLEQQIRLLGRLGRHEAARRRMETLRDEALRANLIAPALNLLAESTSWYPDRAVQAAAADAARVMASRVLVAAPAELARPVLDAVRRLAPEDRLLTRDCQRYERDLRAPGRPSRSAQEQAAARRSFVRAIQLPKVKGWLAAASTAEFWYAVGSSDRYSVRALEVDAAAVVPRSVPGHVEHRLCLLRGRWDDLENDCARLDWNVAERELGPIILAPDPLERGPVFLSTLGGEARLKPSVIPPGRGVRREMYVQPPPGSALGVARSRAGVDWVVAGVPLTLFAYDAWGHIVSSRTLGLDASHMVLPVPMWAFRQQVLVAQGDQLLIVGGNQEAVRSETLPGEVRRLCGTPWHRRPRAAALFARGAALLWHDGDAERMQYLADDLAAPAAAFTAAGYLVIAADNCFEVYDTETPPAKLIGRRDGTGSNPVAVLATSRPEQFAILSSDGWLRIYRGPEGE